MKVDLVSTNLLNLMLQLIIVGVAIGGTWSVRAHVHVQSIWPHPCISRSTKLFSAKSYFHRSAKVFSLKSFPLHGTLSESHWRKFYIRISFLARVVL